METLNAQVGHLVQQSLSPATWKVYQRGVSAFNHFRVAQGLSPTWPALFNHIILFVAYLSLQNYSCASISTFVSAISFIHKINNLYDPTTSFFVRKLIEGYKRENYTSDMRCPITVTVLRKIFNVLSSVCRSNYETKLFKTAFLLAFYGFLRASEYCALTKKGDTSKMLQIGDVSFSSPNLSFVEITIRSSKTDQRGASVKIRFTEHKVVELCPVRALSNFIEIRPPGGGPLFVHLDGSPLTYYQINFVIKKCVEKVGLPSKFFSSHSFRIGAATSAASSGCSEETIKLYGRWKSAAMTGYIRPQYISLGPSDFTV